MYLRIEGGRSKGGRGEREGNSSLACIFVNLARRQEWGPRATYERRTLAVGYEATVFGVHYQCSVKIPEDPIIRVIPILPLLQVRSFPVPTSAVEETNGGVKQRRPSKAGVELVELLDGER